MINLKDYFIQFPEDGSTVEFNNYTFTYNKELNYWSHVPVIMNTTEFIDNYCVTIYSTTTIFFNKNNFEWDTVKNFGFFNN